MFSHVGIGGFFIQKYMDIGYYALYYLNKREFK